MMRYAFAVPLTGLTLILCPLANADPDWTTEDWNYTKYLSEYGVNYQGRVTTNEMIAKAHYVCDTVNGNPTKAGLASARDGLVKQGILTSDEAKKVSDAAINVYCSNFSSLLYSS